MFQIRQQRPFFTKREPKVPINEQSQGNLPAGFVIDERYEIISWLGRGGMSTVYKAKHLALGRLAAIKLLNKERLGDPKAQQRFRNEAIAVSGLKHPNIVEVFGFGAFESQPYMAMEYLEGTSLSELLKQEHHLAQPRALRIFEQICDALDHAHAKGIVHRDLKPSNVILMGPDDAVKLVDFGIARVLPESGKEMQKLTQTSEIFGTLLYMSPEQCTGAKVDARSDIYSMGCLMYEVLTGEPPFNGSTPFVLIHKHQSEEAPENDKLQGDLAPVVQHALSKDPEQRPQSAMALKHELQNPPKISRRFSTVSRAPTKKPLVVASFAALALLVSILGFAWINYGGSGDVSETALRLPPAQQAEMACRQLDDACKLIQRRKFAEARKICETVTEELKTDQGFSSSSVNETIRVRMMAADRWREAGCYEDALKVADSAIDDCRKDHLRVDPRVANEAFDGHGHIYDDMGKHDLAMQDRILGLETLEHSFEPRQSYSVNDAKFRVPNYIIHGRYLAASGKLSEADRKLKTCIQILNLVNVQTAECDELRADVYRTLAGIKTQQNDPASAQIYSDLAARVAAAKAKK